MKRPASVKLIRVAVLALCLAGGGHAFAQAAVHSRAELEQRMASGATPLDALTPYGKRMFLEALPWGERGLTGLPTAQLVRELSAAQIADVLRFLDCAQYIDMLTRRMGDGAPLRFPAPAADIEAASREFNKFHDDDRRRRDLDGAGTELGAAALVRYYHASFDARMRPDELMSRQPADLLLLFDVASQVVLDSGDPHAFGHMQALYVELGRRGIDTRRTVDESMLNALLETRRFAEAAAFARAHPRPGRAAIARPVDTLGAGFRGRSVYHVDAAANTLTRIAAPAPQGTQVVMVVDAGCHYSAQALEAIGNDAGLFARLRRANLLVVTAPRSAIHVDFIAKWNADYPQLALRAPFSAEEWSDVDVTGVPAFFILENGRVRTKVTGWPGQQQKAALLQALDGRSP